MASSSKYGASKRIAIGHGDLARGIGTDPFVPGHRQDVGRRKFQQLHAGIRRPRSARGGVDGRRRSSRWPDIGVDTRRRSRVRSRTGWPKSAQVIMNCMPKRRAARGVPGDAVAAAARIVQSPGGVQDICVGCRWRLQPGLGEPVLAVEQQFRRGLAGDSVGPTAPMRRLASRRCENPPGRGAADPSPRPAAAGCPFPQTRRSTADRRR